MISNILLTNHSTQGFPNFSFWPCFSILDYHQNMHFFNAITYWLLLICLYTMFIFLGHLRIPSYIQNQHLSKLVCLFSNAIFYFLSLCLEILILGYKFSVQYISACSFQDVFGFHKYLSIFYITVCTIYYSYKNYVRWPSNSIGFCELFGQFVHHKNFCW